MHFGALPPLFFPCFVSFAQYFLCYNIYHRLMAGNLMTTGRSSYTKQGIGVILGLWDVDGMADDSYDDSYMSALADFDRRRIWWTLNLIRILFSCSVDWDSGSGWYQNRLGLYVA